MFLVVPPGGSFRETRRIELGARTMTIGRGEKCDIRVDIPGVDSEHAKISEVALVALGADCAVGDVPLDAGSRRLVMPGDEVQIGSVVLALEGDDPHLLSARRTSSGRVPAALAYSDAPCVRVVEGPNFGDELILVEEGKTYVIGRSADCDLILDDREVSREHAKLVRRGFGVVIEDLSSTRGSWLGRSAVFGKVDWSRPRMLRIGASVLALDLPEGVRKAAPAARASAPMTPAPRRRASSSGELGSSNGAIAEDRESTAAVVSDIPPPDVSRAKDSPTRRAWKNSGPRAGKLTGVLVLLAAVVLVLVGLFVIFSMFE